jgi:hypothetical protein
MLTVVLLLIVATAMAALGLRRRLVSGEGQAWAARLAV